MDVTSDYPEAEYRIGNTVVVKLDDSYYHVKISGAEKHPDEQWRYYGIRDYVINGPPALSFYEDQIVDSY